MRGMRVRFSRRPARQSASRCYRRTRGRQPARSILARSRGIVCGNRSATGRWLRPSGRRKRHRDESLMAIAKQSLLQTRRPVLLAPARPQSDLTDSVMIAWDESPECWHAVSAAMPFMQLAKSVRVISVDRDASNREASQAEVLAYLRCHGIGATAQVVAPELRSVGDTLLTAGAEHEAGMLVMGAYSHSRLREMLLGGATRHVLKNASARPVLLAH